MQSVHNPISEERNWGREQLANSKGKGSANPETLEWRVEEAWGGLSPRGIELQRIGRFPVVEEVQLRGLGD